MCLACHRWSRHRDWYHESIGDSEHLEEVKTEPELEPTRLP
jgi:hypothetical protein